MYGCMYVCVQTPLTIFYWFALYVSQVKVPLIRALKYNAYFFLISRAPSPIFLVRALERILFVFVGFLLFFSKIAPVSSGELNLNWYGRYMKSDDSKTTVLYLSIISLFFFSNGCDNSIAQDLSAKKFSSIISPRLKISSRRFQTALL